MNKICLLIPYFGSFNNYFSFWLTSALKNDFIDFIFITDNKTLIEWKDKNKRNNIKVVKSTFESTKECIIARIKPLIGDDLSLDNPYKLCDYKPLYGYIFSDLISDYSFWGHCDVDLVFGDMKSFIPIDAWERYDRIYSHGHLSFYRNVDEVNTFFMRSVDNTVGIPDYKTVFTSHLSFAFDEWPGLSRIWKQQCEEKMYDKMDFDDISFSTKHFESYHKVRMYGTDKGKSHFAFEYDKGTLYRWYIINGQLKKEKTLYAHFQKRNFKIETENAEHYLIVPNKFINYQVVTIGLLKKYCGKKWFYLHYWKIRYNNLKRIIRQKLNR